VSATAAPQKPRARDRAPAPARTKRRGRWLGLYSKAVIAYLFLPIAVMILFGFNDPKGRFNYTFQGFTLRYYSPSELLAFPELNEAMRHSLIVMGISALAATTFGTLIALALTRYRFRGRGAFNLFLFLPMATPEITMGSALLALFVTLNVSRGLTTIVIAHIMFSISYVVVTVKARTATLDRHLEDAAADLGADPWTTFRTVTFPLIRPAILAGALLAAVLSFDDYVITLFNKGAVDTVPTWIAGATRIGVPVQVNVLGTLVFMVGVVYVVINLIRTRGEGTPAIAPR